MYKYCISIAFFCFLTPKPSTSLWACGKRYPVHWRRRQSMLFSVIGANRSCSSFILDILVKDISSSFKLSRNTMEYKDISQVITGSPDGSKSIGQMFKVAPWDRTEASQNTANRKVENDKTTFINPQNVNGARWFQHISTFILLYFLYRFHWTEWTVEVDRVGKTLGNHRC